MKTLFLLSPTIFAARLAISLGIGIRVGIERAWAHKEVGMRTFAIISLLGMLGSLLGPPFALASVAGAFLLVAYINLRSLLADQSLEMTTSASLMVVVILGVLVGEGHVFVPIASAIIVTMRWPGRSKSHVLPAALISKRSAARSYLDSWVL